MNISLTILLTAGTLFSFYWLLKKREVLKAGWPMAAVLAIGHTLVGVVCVKVFAVLETLDLSKAGNMSLFGAVFFLPVVYWCGAKLTGRKIADVFDVFTPCLVFTLLCARVNCLFSDCCLGQMLPGGSGLRWPTRELEILFYLVLLAWLIRQERRDKTPGCYYPVYMIAYGAVRFFLEGFRQSDSPAIIHISHFWAAITFCLGLSIYTELKRKKTRRKQKRA